MAQVKRNVVGVVGVVGVALCAALLPLIAAGASPVRVEPAVAAWGAMPDARLAAATKFRVTTLTKSTVGVAWNVGAGTQARVRRTSGIQPAKSVRDGVGVPVSGSTARVTGLSPGSQHTFSLFTRVGGAWQGPVAISVGTVAPAGSSAASYVSKTNARAVPAAQIVSATVDETGVSVRLRGPLPAVATVLGLPVTLDLPSGYLGVVSSVATGGLVRLKPAGLSRAFDFWKVDITQLPADPAVAPLAAVGKPTCTGAGNPEVDFGNPIPKLDGSFSARMVSPKLPIPGTTPGVRVRGELTAMMDLNGRVKSDGAATCTQEFTKITKVIRAGWVPVLLSYQPKLELAIDSAIDLSNVGFTATGKASFDTEFNLGGVVNATADFTAQFAPRVSTGLAEGSMSLSLVGDVNVGWGEAVGLHVRSELPKGKITVKKPASPADPYCVTAELGAHAKADVFANLWLVGTKPFTLGEWTIASLPGSPWSWPPDCGGKADPTAILLLGYAPGYPIHEFIKNTLIDANYEVVAIQGYNLLNLERDRFKQVWDLYGHPDYDMQSQFLQNGANGHAPGMISFCTHCATDLYFLDGYEAAWDGPPPVCDQPDQCPKLATRFGDWTIGSVLRQVKDVPVDDTLAFHQGRSIGYVKEEPEPHFPGVVRFRLIALTNVLFNYPEMQAFMRDNGDFIVAVADFLAQPEK